MKSLSEALTILPNIQRSTEQNRNIFPTSAHGSITIAGMIISPRNEPISVDKAIQGFRWLRLLKSYRKINRKAVWNDAGTSMEMKMYSTYRLPDNVTHESVIKGLTELLRPCSPMVTKAFVELQAFKPFYKTDEDRIKIVYQGLYRDLKELPEAAVIMACDDLRNTNGKWFPIEDIVPTVSGYRDLIHSALDYFQGEN